MKNNISPADASIKSISVFFAALVSISLSHLFDVDIDKGQDRWIPFIVAVLLFLRFITGSANHLWYTYLSPEREQISDRDLILDLFMLTGFGIIATVMSSSLTSKQFFFGGIVLLGIAIIWNLLHRIPKMKTRGSKSDLNPWLWLDAIHFILFVVALWLECYEIGCVDFYLFRARWSWLILLLSGVIILAIDFNYQLRIFKLTQEIPE